MATKATPPVKIKVRAFDGSGTLDGSLSRPLALRMIYISMSPAERAEVRNVLDNIDIDIAEEAANG